MGVLPQTQQTFDQLPDEELARQEAVQEVFGEQLFNLCNAVMEQVEQLVNDPEKRAPLGAIRSNSYDAVAVMQKADRRFALGLAQTAIHLYIQHLMAMLDDEGVHMKLGELHFLHYKLSLEVLRVLDGELLEEHVVNRTPLPTLGEKYGKWLNQRQRVKAQNDVTRPSEPG